MKIPASLAKGLSEEQTQQLERELKSSILAKQLRKVLNNKIEQLLYEEEVLSLDFHDIAKMLGERRGFREILNLLPEE